jgi:hypothetical protein
MAVVDAAVNVQQRVVHLLVVCLLLLLLLVELVVDLRGERGARKGR